MKHEWRKHEKNLYLPKPAPELIKVPDMQFLTISGQGNPNSEGFAKYIEILYTLSYALKMGFKKGPIPQGYLDYTVYPLEGVWDITEEAKEQYHGVLNKDDLVFKLMIRQPDFIARNHVDQAIARVAEKKDLALLGSVVFEEISEGSCVQMLHVGSYDDEPATFEVMEKYCTEQNLKRLSKRHREIYLSDFRKVKPDQLKTVLRFQVKKTKMMAG